MLQGIGLGMFTMIRKAFQLVLKHYDRKLALANVPQDDPKVYYHLPLL